MVAVTVDCYITVRWTELCAVLYSELYTFLYILLYSVLYSELHSKLYFELTNEHYINNYQQIVKTQKPGL